MEPAQGACLLEEAKDECVEPHGVVGELCVLADLAIEAVQQLGRGAYEEKQNVKISHGQQSKNCTTGRSIKAKTNTGCVPMPVCVLPLHQTPRRTRSVPTVRLHKGDELWSASDCRSRSLGEFQYRKDLPPTLQRQPQPLAQSQQVQDIVEGAYYLGCPQSQR